MVIDNILLLTIVFLVALLGAWLFFVTQNARVTRKRLHQIAEQQTLVHSDEDARRLCIAIHQLHPTMHAGVDFLIRRDSPEAAPYIAEWFGASPKPGPQELEAALAKIAGKSYVDLRKSEYPSVGDQLDAAFKARRGDNSEQAFLDSRISDIKNKYPKSEICK